MKILITTSLLLLIAACSTHTSNREVANIKAWSGAATVTEYTSVKGVKDLERATNYLYNNCARKAINADAIVESHSLDLLNYEAETSELAAMCSYKKRDTQRGCPEAIMVCGAEQKRVEFAGLSGCPVTHCVNRDSSVGGQCKVPTCPTNAKLVDIGYEPNGCVKYVCKRKPRTDIDLGNGDMPRMCPQDMCPDGMSRGLDCSCERNIPRTNPSTGHTTIAPICPAVQCRDDQREVPGTPGTDHPCKKCEDV